MAIQLLLRSIVVAIKQPINLKYQWNLLIIKMF